MANQSSNDVDLLLVGKTGHGKSSTGNAILGREAFHVSDGSTSDTYHVQASWSRRQGRVLKVVDGPGLCETRLSKGEAAKKTSHDMAQAIAYCSKGFHALLLVLKYGNRFTEEELMTVEMLKALFGQNFVKEYCIIVFTHGELFDMNNEETPNRTFVDWCGEQTGPLKTLLKECDYKTVLFYNKKKNHNEAQLQELLSIVDQMKSKGVRYTNEIFHKSEKSREKLIVQENAPQLREAIQAKINLITTGLEQVKVSSEWNEQRQETLDQLKGDVRDLQTEVAVQDKGSGVLDPLKQLLVNIAKNINNHEEALRKDKSAAEVQSALRLAEEKYEDDLQKMRMEERNALQAMKRGILGTIGDYIDGLISSVIQSTILGKLPAFLTSKWASDDDDD